MGWATCEQGDLGQVEKLPEPQFPHLPAGVPLTSQDAC